MTSFSALGLYVLAALAEIAGCFAFWAWARMGRSAFWLLPGTLSLLIFALILTRVDATFAGRAYAAYGGIYIATSVAWLRFAEGQMPGRYDLIGAAVSVLGALIILAGATQR